MQTAANNAASAPVEDYVKAIYALTLGPDQTASTSQIAERLGITAGSVSTMIKRMDASGLAEHVPYRGVRLTPAGRKLALAVIRRHRLLELFLATSLDIPWENVHGFADALEHAASDELIELIAIKLGDPVADPHGDPIPNRLLEVDDRAQPTIAELRPGEQARVVKLAVNLVIAGLAQLMSEALVLGEASGVSRRALLETMGDSAAGAPFVKYKTEPLLRDDYSATFTTSLMEKDIDLVLEAAEAAGVRLPLAGEIKTLVRSAIEAGYGDDDFMALFLHLRSGSDQEVLR